jgi:hypothetical protein
MKERRCKQTQTGTADKARDDKKRGGVIKSGKPHPEKRDAD